MKDLKNISTILIFLTSVISASSALAQSGGGSGNWSIGFNAGIINADQDDMNDVISAASSTTGASDFDNAYEMNAHLTYRMSGGMTALSLRPSYFFYTEETGTDAAYNMGGFTIFPTLKWYLLEDQTIKFFSQFGIGYGRIWGEIQNGSDKVEFSGGGLGYMAGLGAEFCFFASHCVNIEGNIRFLTVERMKVDNSDCTAPFDTVTQCTKDQEFEINERDFAASMSGVLGMVGYTLYF